MPRKRSSINYFMGGAEGQPSPAANTKRPANNKGSGATAGNNRRAQANNKATNSNTNVNIETPESGKKGVMGNITENVQKSLEKVTELGKNTVNVVKNKIVEPIRRTAGLSPSSEQPAPAASTPSTQSQGNASPPPQPEASKERGYSILFYVLVGLCVVIVIALIYYIYKVYFVTEKYEDEEDKEALESLNGFKDFNGKNLSPFTIDDANDCMKIF